MIVRTCARALVSFVLLAVAATSCAAGRGTAAFDVWGEAYIEQEIPASDVEDGWSIRFSRFVVGLRQIEVGPLGAPVAQTRGATVLALTAPGKKPVASFDDLPEGEHDVSFVLGPVDAAATLAPGTTEADRAALVAGGASLVVEGEATKGAVTKRFAWAFATTTRYVDCKAEVDGRELVGVSVTNGGEDRAELTVHGDHLFYDDLEATTAKVRFEAIARADADGDGEVTLAELAAQKLAALDPALGVYGTGSAPDVTDLAGFVTALSRTVGHFRGEGECVVRND